MSGATPHGLAGKPAPATMLIDVARLETASISSARRTWPTRGSASASAPAATAARSLDGTFTEAHILAITQAICDYRRGQGIDGPLYMGKDTHALSGAGPAHRAGGAGGQRRRDDHPARRRRHADAGHLARHPRLQPRPHGPPRRTASSSRRRTIRRRTAASSTTRPTAARPTPTSRSWIQDRANALLRGEQRRRQAHAVRRGAARRRRRTQQDFVLPYVDDLRNVIDMDAIRAAGLKLGVDPLGGAALHYWEPIAESYGLNITVVNPTIDPTFRLHDGRSRRQDPHGLLQPLRDGQAGRPEGPSIQVAFGNDPDADRHGIVTPSAGLMNPNHLPGGGDPLPARRTARLAGDARRSARRWSAAA